MKNIKKMEEWVLEYLSMRRRLGFAMKIEGQELLRFAKYADKVAPGENLKTQLAICWSNSTKNGSSIYSARRLDLVRRFAKYLFQFVPATEIPPKGILGPTHKRPSPYIYSDQQIALLLNTTSKLGPPAGLRPRTFTTLFGLLVSSGIRISEALSLNNEDINFDNKTIFIRQGKFQKSRIVPIHLSVSNVLEEYSNFRNTYHPQTLTPAFFVTEKNTRQKYHKILMTFIAIRKQLNWEIKKGNQTYPRIHDFRHTFVVKRILMWYEEGIDVNKKLPALSTYLGHVKISDTYWYLTAIPELMSKISSQFEIYAKELWRTT